MATLVGKVGMVMKGDWSSGSAYEVLDTVTYSGSLYTAKKDVPAGTLPTNTTYWQRANGYARTIVDEVMIASQTDSALIYSGISYTIPANSTFSLCFALEWASGQPLELAISDSNTDVSATHLMGKSDVFLNISVVGGTANSSKTLYVWARHLGSTATGRVRITGIIESNS